jgi:hypothetical protein
LAEVTRLGMLLSQALALRVRDRELDRCDRVFPRAA